MFITDQEMKEMQSRNEARAKAMRESMGARHLLHPANAPKKVEHKFVLSAQ